MLRNQFIMPPLTDSLVTLTWMEAVLEGSYWCLHSDQVRGLKVCADPPAKKDLAAILGDALDAFDPGSPEMALAMKRTALRVRQCPPSTPWMITVLSTLEPDNAIFARDYVRPREERPQAAQNDLVPNPNGFFSGLPIPKRGGKKSKVSVSFGSKVVRKEQEVENL